MLQSQTEPPNVAMLRESQTTQGGNQIFAAGFQGTVITCHFESQLLPQGSRSVLYNYPYYITAC